MSKILLTGMSAPQTSPNANKRSLEFAGVLNQVLLELGHEVTWGDPSIYASAQDFTEFDTVLVGLAPITSLGANRAYGALATIDALWGTDKLRLFIDSASVSQIEVALKSVTTSPDNLVKDFFSYRKGFVDVKSSDEVRGRIFSAIKKLLNDTWPLTVYPELPWGDVDSVIKNLPTGAETAVSGINLDSFLLKDVTPGNEKADKWVYDIPSPHWTKKVASTLNLPTSPMKHNKGATDSDVEYQMARSIGVLISSDKRQGTWWTYRYVQALNSQAPIATEWKESRKIGAEWATLAATIEDYPQRIRDTLAIAQRDTYVANIPSKIEAGKTLQDLLNIK
jgi:hypothetical protein